jgi:uncharacterized protein (DUF486 family)
MTIAWYGHLKFEQQAAVGRGARQLGHRLLRVLLQVPANRWGHASYSAPQLKGMQEVITLLVFAGFSTVPGRAAEVEPLGRLRADRRRRLADLPEVIRT